jgi:Ca2+-transporting ATPase
MESHHKTVSEVVEELGSSLNGLSSEEAAKRLNAYGPNELKEKDTKAMSEEIRVNWHKMDIREVVEDLDSSLEGLSTEESQRRLSKYGPNELKEKEKKSPVRMFFDQFGDFMILVLLAAAVVSGFIGELTDTIAILVIVVLNAVIGFIQEYRAEKAMAALKKMAAPTAAVLRDGMVVTVPAAELVPGDVVVLDAGKIVPADMRLVESARLTMEEAALTGESTAVEKHTRAISDERLPLGDRKNLAYKGTFVTYGRGIGMVVGTGMNTELGKIAAMLQDEKEVKTPLQKRLAVFGRKLAIAVLIICAVVFGIGLLRGEPILLMLLTAISLAVAAIPEALPAVVTISLALGARKLVKQNALIRKLPAVETLGSVTYICSDKTGTLTLNKMAVTEVLVGGKDRRDTRFQPNDGADRLFLTAMALNNDVQATNGGSPIGDPTEIALFHMAGKHHFNKPDLEKAFPRVGEIPFDSDRKLMTTFHENSSGHSLIGMDGPGYLSFTKGAVESLIQKSRDMLTSDGLKPVDVDEINRVQGEMAANGLRVLGLAVRSWQRPPENMAPEDVEQGLSFLGLVGMMDPPREEAKEAVSMCKQAGIRPVMITGDHPATARAIARTLGIIAEGEDDRVVTGVELERFSEKEMLEGVDRFRVYARVAPEQKLKIVKALQERGEFAAMTGDGVNDAPALKRADIGVAMGITGTDVSKEAADMILLDDNFATIVKAVREGRKIYDNIRKFIRYLLTTNSGEIWTLFLAPLVGLPIPLLPIHILWINLVTDGLPALALSVEPAEKDVMRRPPRHPKESILSQGLGVHAIWVGLLMGIVVLLVQAWSLENSGTHWQTMVFTVLCLLQLGHVLAIRSETQSLFTLGLFSNKPLLGAVLLTFLLQMATIYVPFCNSIFHTQPLTLSELAFAVAVSSVVFWGVELEKTVIRWRSGRRLYEIQTKPVLGGSHELSGV